MDKIFETPVRTLVEHYGLMPKRNFGQNFIFDLNVTDRIVRYVPSHSKIILEVGPGPGSLTRSLLKGPFDKVIAIEKDERFRPLLQAMQGESNGRLDVIFGDALNIQLSTLSADPIAIVANLPYNVATPLLIKWIVQINHVSSMTLMFQKEVAERITAVPRTKDYGRLSIMSQWSCQTDILFDVSPQVFFPPPKVTSSIVQLIPKKPLDLTLFPYLEKVTQAAFSCRRKMLRKNVADMFTMGDLLNLGIKDNQRAEELSVDHFIRLAHILKERN